MSTAASLPSLSKLHDLLNLLSELRDLSNPFDSPAALKSTLELLADLGAILGVNPDLLNWLTDIENNTPLQMTNRNRKPRPRRRSDFRPPTSDLKRSPTHPPPRLYHLVISCRDESHQRSLYEELTSAGHPCRVITL